MLAWKVNRSMFLQSHRFYFRLVALSAIALFGSDFLWIFSENGYWLPSRSLNWLLNGVYYVCMTLLGDMIVGGDFQITVDDKVIRTQGSARFEAMATPLFQYKNFVFLWGGSYGKEHRCAYLLTPYLASINNLGSAVVKNTDKTMKITYTLTEETM